MFKYLAELIEKMSPLDVALLLTVMVSLLLKIGKDIFVLLWSRHIEKKSNDSCKFLKSMDDGSYCCTHPTYINRTFAQHGNRCLSTVCHGYRAENINGEDIIYSSLQFSLLMAGIDWVIHISSLTLVIRTLLGVTSA